jgi:endoglucanase
MKTRLAVLAAAVALCLGAHAEPGTMRDITSVALAKEMVPGWNLGNALEAMPEETSWGNPRANQELFNAVKAAGFKSVRIPVSWNAHTGLNGKISDSFMARVTEVVNEARAAGLYVVLNEHWDGGWQEPTAAKQAEVNAKLAALWTEIADHFKDYDDHLLFAGTNEVMVKGNYGPPSAENAAAQNSFNQTFVTTVRATGGNNAKRVLVVQGYNTNIEHTVANAVLPSDPAPNRLMMEVHFYDPYNFTLNEKSRVWQWGALTSDPSAAEAWANEAYVDGAFEKMKTHFIDKGVGVLLGEYSAIMKAEYPGNERQRTYWDAYITKSAIKHGMVPMYWDAGATGNHGSALFDRHTATQPYPYLTDAIVKMAQ